MWQQLKTIALLGGLSALLLVLGNLIGGQTGVIVALILALIMNGTAYFFSDTIVLRMYKATQLDPQEYNWLYQMVQELASTMQIPMPKLWLIDTPMANAFATGRNPQHASVAVTSGILTLLDRHELRGVLAHELAHVKNRDILVTSCAAVLAAAIGYLAYMLQHAAFTRDRQQKSNGLLLFFAALITPLAATLLQLAVSRSREYLADQTGAHECQDPLALAAALEKLYTHIPQAHLDPDKDGAKATTASLFIVHPFTREGLSALFSTHPPMYERIARLKNMARTDKHS